MKPVVIAVACLFGMSPFVHAGVTGQYVEARTCDVYTGPCFANASTGLSGRHAVMAWKIDKGAIGNVKLDGLSVVAIVAAKDTLGLKQVVAGKSVVLVDEKSNAEQRKALVELARREGGILLENVVDVRSAPINVEICNCKGNACAKVKAGDAKVETRCLDVQHDKACGNETAFYPPLSKDVKAKPAMAVEHAYTGLGFGETWSDSEQRGAYVGTFAVK